MGASGEERNQGLERRNDAAECCTLELYLNRFSRLQ
jgi:hypothetical protein